MAMMFLSMMFCSTRINFVALFKYSANHNNETEAAGKLR